MYRSGVGERRLPTGGCYLPRPRLGGGGRHRPDKHSTVRGARNRRIAPAIRRVHTVHAGAHFLRSEALLDEIAAAEGSFWFPAVRDVTPERVEAARRRGLGVATWTANSATEMKRLLALGVDSICTDYPDRLRSVLAA